MAKARFQTVAVKSELKEDGAPKDRTPSQLLLLMPSESDNGDSASYIYTAPAPSPNPNMVLVSQNAAPVRIPVVEKPYFRSVKGHIADEKEVGTVCRTCYRGIFNDQFVKLYDDDNQETSEKLRHMLSEVNPGTDLEVYLDPVMCNKCVKMLYTSYEFKMKCLNTEEKFNEWIVQRRGVHRTDVNLLVLVEKSTNCDDLNEEKEEQSIKREVVPERVLNSVEMDHDYFGLPTEAPPSKERKRFCFELELSGERMAKCVKRRTESSKGPFLCEQCGDVTESYLLHRKHLLLHAGVVDNFVGCSRCNFFTSSSLALKKHTRRHNKRLIGFKRGRPQKKPPLDLKRVRANRSNLLCHSCGQEFGFYTSFQKHLRSHTPEKQKNGVQHQGGRENTEFHYGSDNEDLSRLENQLVTYFKEDDISEDESVYVDVVQKKIITVKELKSLC